MPTIRPFAALRPRPELAPRICELPYDVMSTEEARLVAEGNPLSFLRVSKPELELDSSVDPYSPEVYARGAENFASLIRQGSLLRDSKPSLYLYRQVMGNHYQVGLVALASCEEYLQGLVKRHELTRPDKEDDRVRHIEALNAQTGPVFLTYRDQPDVNSWVDRRLEGAPDTDFVSPDGIRHSAWSVAAPEDVAWLVQAFARIPCMYIADGHHRSAAAARVADARQGKGLSNYFLSVIFPHRQMQILPYNRVVRDLNGRTASEFLAALGRVATVAPAENGVVRRKHEVGLYMAGGWRVLSFKNELTNGGDPVDRLDVALLQNHILGPLLGIEDPRTSRRIAFVGGIRGVNELEQRVNAGLDVCAFSMFPTGIEDLMEIADAGGIMPPKSTWFEPKLRDALFCHVFDSELA